MYTWDYGSDALAKAGIGKGMSNNEQNITLRMAKLKPFPPMLVELLGGIKRQLKSPTNTPLLQAHHIY